MVSFASLVVVLTDRYHSVDRKTLTAHNFKRATQQVLLVGLVRQSDLVLLLLWTLSEAGRVANLSVC